MSTQLLLLTLLVALMSAIWALTRPGRQGEFTLRVGKNLFGLHLRLDQARDQQQLPAVSDPAAAELPEPGQHQPDAGLSPASGTDRTEAWPG